jgi:hypothetical protein
MRKTKQESEHGWMLQRNCQHNTSQGIACCTEREPRSGQSAFVPKCIISGDMILYILTTGHSIDHSASIRYNV